MMGVYRIVNLTNGKFYVGSSKDVELRWHTHVKSLRNGKHPNIVLQRSWTKYGENSFVFGVMEEVVSEAALLPREQHYLDALRPLLNIGRHALGGDNVSKHPKREEIRAKHRAGTYWKTDKAREVARKRIGPLNSNYGNRWDDGQKDRAREWMKKYYEEHDHVFTGKTLEEYHGKERAEEISRKISDAAKQRIGDKNPFFGKKHSQATLDKIRNANLGNRPPNMVRVSINGVEYESLAAASRILGISISLIYHRLTSKSPKYAAYLYLGR